MRFLALFLCLLSGQLVFSHSKYPEVSFAHSANKITDKKMHSFRVLGERCSGTNFIDSLIESNFPKASCLKFLHNSKFHKHFIPWLFDESLVYMHPYYPFPSENVLYVVVIRDLFDWIRSFYDQPWHLDECQKKNGFAGFIRQTWTPKNCSKFFETSNPWEEVLADFGEEIKNADMVSYLIDGEDPIAHKPFENILKLRTRKYQNYLRLSEYVNNVIYVKYEDVNGDPQGFVDFLSKLFEYRVESFVPILTYKGDKRREYAPKKYFDLKIVDKYFILSKADLDQEAFFGYEYLRPTNKHYIDELIRLIHSNKQDIDTLRRRIK